MCFRDYKIAGVAFLIFLGCDPGASLSQTKSGKAVWNYDGGVFFETDGSLPNGVCFRVSGEMNAGEFFEHLKRVDDQHGTVFRRGPETVGQFPEALAVSFAIRDQPCAPGLHDIRPHIYLTREMVSHLQLMIYWKRGLDLRPVKNVTEVEARVERVSPYAATLAADLPPRFQWSYQLLVPSAGVPLTDSLVFVFRTVEGRIAARVAARL
jgi:hypothetical protein